MTWTRRRIVASAAGAVACVAAATSLGFVFSGTPVPKAPPRQSPTATPTPSATHSAAPTRLLSPFTGEPVKTLGPVLAVKIDNIVYARPQTGLTDADIVYVLPVEGGLSRFLAIFS
jgi:hypothetical protein